MLARGGLKRKRQPGIAAEPSADLEEADVAAASRDVLAASNDVPADDASLWISDGSAQVVNRKSSVIANSSRATFDSDPEDQAEDASCAPCMLVESSDVGNPTAASAFGDLAEPLAASLPSESNIEAAAPLALNLFPISTALITASDGTASSSRAGRPAKTVITSGAQPSLEGLHSSPLLAKAEAAMASMAAARGPPPAGKTKLASKVPEHVDLGEIPQACPPQEVHLLLEKLTPGAKIQDNTATVIAQMADRFIDEVVDAAARVARHRGSRLVEAKDVRLILEMNWGISFP